MRAWALAAALLLAPLGADAQLLGLGGQDDGKPLKIDADQGIEWHQNERAYVARGNAKATRGNVTVRGDRTGCRHAASDQHGPQPHLFS